jgi:hypothetical protein
MKVATLISVPSKESFQNCTLVLGSLSVGFPNDDITVYVNANSEKFLSEIEFRAGDHRVVLLPHTYHHAEWIREMVWKTDGELVIVDGDVTLWQEWKWKFKTLLAGHLVPLMWNEFAQCISYPRLHTSFLQIRDCNELLDTIDKLYPMAVTSPKYAPLDVWMPSVKFANGKPLFWDSCSVLYNALGGTPFTEEQLECYDHLNSASFLGIMEKNMVNGKDFRQVHETVSRTPELLKGRWRETNEYYNLMHNKAIQMLGV